MRILNLFLILSVSVSCAHLGSQHRDLKIQRMWAKELPFDTDLGPQRYHGMTPIVSNDVVYQGNGKDGFHAINRKSGALVWQRKIENGVGGGAQLWDGHLYFGGSDGQFYSVKASDGNLAWTFPVRAEILATPLIAEGTVYFLAANNVIYAIDAKTGKQKWLYNRSDTTTFSIRGGSQPVLYKQSLIVGFSDGFLVSLNSKTGALAWERSLNRNAKFKDVNGTAVVDGNHIYISSFDDSLYKLSAEDGQIIWRVEKGGHTHVVLDGSKLYYSTSEGELLALEKETGKVIWANKLSNGIYTAPALLNELLVVGESRGEFVVFNAADGKKVGSYTSGRGLLASPHVDQRQGEVFFISNDGNLFKLKLSWEKTGHRMPWERK